MIVDSCRQWTLVRFERQSNQEDGVVVNLLESIRFCRISLETGLCEGTSRCSSNLRLLDLPKHTKSIPNRLNP